MKERIQPRVWILMHRTSERIWQPSFDYGTPWRTLKAARRKWESLGEPLKRNYRIVCYELRQTH